MIIWIPNFKTEIPIQVFSKNLLYNIAHDKRVTPLKPRKSEHVTMIFFYNFILLSTSRMYMVLQSYMGVSTTTVQYSGINKHMMRMRCEGDNKQTTLYIQVPYFTTGFTRSSRGCLIACLK